ncbi:MAG: DUF4157 domain-containing protein [Deltaproteobacteria bacterium]|nr:DUF4157 domain-containing protein [Deltaproteobacteria bacterium]
MQERTGKYGGATSTSSSPGDHGDPGRRSLTDGLVQRAHEGVAGAGGPLPHQAELQAAFGPDHDLAGVSAHIGGPAAAACADLGASAYATGSDVAFGASPDLHTAAHEAAHVVQQRAGVQLYGGLGVPGDRHEQHADAVADRVVAGQSAADLLAPFGAGQHASTQVQCHGGRGADGSAGHRIGGSGAGGELHRRSGQTSHSAGGVADSHDPSHHGDVRNSAGAATDLDDAVGHGGAAVSRSLVNLGVFSSMKAVEVLLAGYMRSAAPQPGDAIKLELEASVCVEGLYAKLKLEAEIAHEADGGFKLAGESHTAFGLGEETEGAKAELGVFEKKGLDLAGRSPETCVEEIGLYMDVWLRARQWTPASFTDPHKWRQLAEVVFHPSAVGIATLVAGEAIANLIFGRGFQKLVLANMDVGDHVESSHEVGIEAEASFGEKHDGFQISGSRGFGVEERTTSTKVGDGELETETEVGVTAHMAFSLTVLAVTVKLSADTFLPVDGPGELNLGLTLEVDTHGQGDIFAVLIGAFAMAKETFAGKLAASGLDGQADTGPVVGALFGATARNAIETVALASGAFEHIGIQFKSSGSEIVATMFSGGEASAKTGIVNVKTEITMLHEVARWPLPEFARWKRGTGAALG